MADSRNRVVPKPSNAKNAGARLNWGNRLVPRLEGADSMTFEIKNDHCRRTVLRFSTLLIVSNSVLRWRQFRQVPPVKLFDFDGASARTFEISRACTPRFILGLLNRLGALARDQTVVCIAILAVKP